MNKTAIKNFAVSARRKLIAMAADKAGRIGITATTIAEPSSSGSQFAIFPTGFGTQTRLDGDAVGQRASLVSHIKSDGYDTVMEEVAYTWFNRMIAVRFMEVSDYLPTRVRVLSSETPGKFEPDLVTQAPNVDLGFSEAEKEEIYALKDEPEKSGDLFRALFIRQCNALGAILPELFEKTADYTELLLDLSWDKPDGVIRDLLSIDEADFREAVEIVGWMYQYYNTEPKDETFALLKKNVKITKERIPSATQLFTPDWIVRYMVENSLGRLWLEGHPDDGLKSDWKYYLDEAEQEPAVLTQLAQIRSEYKAIRPEDIKIIDPCMGSGHILVYAFDVLMQIYLSCGYTKEDAAALIIRKNIWGVDLDKRAYQLSYFAVMMKGRRYDRRFFTRNLLPNLFHTQNSSNTSLGETAQPQLIDYLTAIKDADTFGTLTSMGEFDLDKIGDAIDSFDPYATNISERIDIEERYANAIRFVRLGQALSQKYDVVVTNPPYMGSSGMGSKLADYVKKNYPDSKSDLFAVFMECGNRLAKSGGYNCMVTMQSWMFLSSFETLRKKLIDQKTIVNLMHMENMVMGIAFGTAVTIIKNLPSKGYKGTYNQIKMCDIDSSTNLPKAFPVPGNRFAQVSTENFKKIPGAPIAYWVSERMLGAFEKGKQLGELAKPRQGMATCDNNRFLRMWYEIENNKFTDVCSDIEEAKETQKKWFPYNKGGDFRKWFGNNEYVINWENDGFEVKAYAVKLYKSVTRTIKNIQFYFKSGITYTFISSSKFGVRYSPNGFIFDVAGSTVFVEKNIQNYILAFMISSITKKYLDALNPTLNFQVGDIKAVPIIFSQKDKPHIDELAQQNIQISKIDWDSFETSWDFEKHPLI